MRRSGDFLQTAHLLKTLGHPVRLKIVCGLLREPANLSRIARELEIPISTLARHLEVLRTGHVLEEERHGVEILFRVADRRVPALLRALCSPGTAGGRLPRWSWREMSKGGGGFRSSSSGAKSDAIL